MSDAGTEPTSHTTRRAYDLLAKGFGGGFSGPLTVAVTLPRTGDSAPVQQVDQALAATHGIGSVAPARFSPTGSTAVVMAYPTTSPQSQATTDLVEHVRNGVLPPIERASGAQVYVGGPTASVVDFSRVLSNRLPVFMALVIGLAMLLLLVVFRSLIIPLQAAVMTMLSVGAAFGISVALFQDGWLGFQEGPIDAFIPLLLFAVIFGLGMDYEVFLVSRIHEEWRKREDASEAVREGIARTGRVITAAAAVMVAVFVSFALSGARILEMFGIGMAAGVLLDALVIRMMLLPAVLQILGRTTWALPRWLDGSLPHVAIEPETTSRPRATIEPAPSAT